MCNGRDKYQFSLPKPRHWNKGSYLSTIHYLNNKEKESPGRFLLVGLCPSNMAGHIMTCIDFSQCTLMSTLQSCPTGTPCHQHHDLICHSVTLFWHWVDQSLCYPNNVDHLARKWEESISKSLLWCDQDSKPRHSDTSISHMGDGRSTHWAIPSGQCWVKW